MSHALSPHRLLRRSRSPAILALALATAAGALSAQSEDETRVERRIQVVFTDEEGVTEERIWVAPDDGGPVVISGDEGEMMIRAAPWFHPQAYLGVHLLDITPELREHFGSTAGAGVLVSAVAEDSPAAAAGIAVGDVVTGIDGAEVARAAQVVRKLAGREEGETVTVELIRDRRSLSVDATLAARPRPQVDLAPMFWTPGDGERRVLRLPHRILEIEKGDLDEAFSELHERMQSPQWRQKLEETTSRHRTLENRIRELEQRLREMERRLEENSD